MNLGHPSSGFQYGWPTEKERTSMRRKAGVDRALREPRARRPPCFLVIQRPYACMTRALDAQVALLYSPSI